MKRQKEAQLYGKYPILALLALKMGKGQEQGEEQPLEVEVPADLQPANGVPEKKGGGEKYSICKTAHGCPFSC